MLTLPVDAQKEEFGPREEGANVEAGRKGGRISAERPPEARKEAARKAARTRAQRYGAHCLCCAATHARHVVREPRPSLQPVTMSRLACLTELRAAAGHWLEVTADAMLILTLV